MTDYLHIQLPPDQIRGISSIGLAHMGDAVYELLVRTWLCAHGKATGKGLHRATVALVCAPKQAELAQRIRRTCARYGRCAPLPEPLEKRPAAPVIKTGKKAGEKAAEAAGRTSAAE